MAGEMSIALWLGDGWARCCDIMDLTSSSLTSSLGVQGGESTDIDAKETSRSEERKLASSIRDRYEGEFGADERTSDGYSGRAGDEDVDGVAYEGMDAVIIEDGYGAKETERRDGRDGAMVGGG